MKISYVLYEFKKMLSDPLMKFMMIYPIILGIVGRFIIPIIEEISQKDISQFEDIVIVSLSLMTPLIYGAVIGFSVLEDRDDKVFQSLKVSPLSIHGYIVFKFMIGFILSVVGCTFVMVVSNIGEMSFISVLSIAILASLAVPLTVMIINVFAANKIEGFAIMKGTGIIIVFPIISLLFTDKKEFIFSFAPGFWPAKVISSLIRGDGILLLSSFEYYLIGLIYVSLLNLLFYRLFLKKAKI